MIASAPRLRHRRGVGRRPHGVRVALAVIVAMVAAACGDLAAPDIVAVAVVEESPLDPPAAGIVPSGGQGWQAVTVGQDHTCALDATGAAYCWGGNSASQLGTASDADPCGPPATLCRRVPTPVDTPLRFGAITAGAQHTCAIARDALAYCWGSNQFGQLGVPSPRTASGPVAVMGDRRWQSIAAGADHTCGVTVDGAAFCWGSNDAGQLGVAGGMRSAPVAVRNPGPFTSVSAGWDRSCATTASGAAFCWGLVWAYAAGGVDYANLVSVPARVPGEGALQGVSAGTLTNCGTRDDDTAVCWGANLFAQRGDGTLAGSTQPLAVRSDVRFRAVSAGSIQSCGIALDRRAHCWGNNSFGQIGTRTLDDCAGIVCARVPAGVAPSLRFVELRTGLGNHVCGITTMTNLYCWGLGTNGQLGVGAREAVIRREPELVQRAR